MSTEAKEQEAVQAAPKESLFSKKNRRLLTDPLDDNNPITVQVLGICSALAITVKLENALVMSASVLFVMLAGNVIISLLRSFRVFDTVVALTQGGPRRSSEVLLFTIYQEGFMYFRIGYAAALTVVFVAVLLALTFVKYRLMDRLVHY
jgi:Na+-transporting NADH:ubiquinone oxidoreductase subunit NqrD